MNIEITLDDKIGARLKHLESARHSPAGQLMREALEQYLEREEEMDRRNHEADQARDHFSRTRMGVGHEDMSVWLKTWGSDEDVACPEPSRQF